MNRFYHDHVCKSIIGILFILTVVIFQSYGCRGAESTMMLWQKEHLFSQVLNEERTLLISLPRGYEASTKDYPVLFVVHALLSRPQLFDAYLASSPMVGWCYPFIAEEALSLFDSRKSLDAFLYIVYGAHDLGRVTQAVPSFEKIIEEKAPKDFRWFSRLIEEEGHVPYTSLLHGLGFVFEGWNFPQERFETATLESIQAYYQKLSSRYGFEVPVPMVVFLETGNSLRRRGEVQKALEVFKVNLKKYPSDPNALFYLGEGYWDNNQKEKAVQYYRKALEKDPNYTPAIHKLKSLEENR